MAVFLGRLAAIRTNQPGPGESSTNQTEGAGSPKVFLKEGFGGVAHATKKEARHHHRFLLRRVQPPRTPVVRIYQGGEVIRFLFGTLRPPRTPNHISPLT